MAVITEGPATGHVDAESGMPVFIDATTLRQILACAKTYSGGLKVKADHGSGVFATAGYLDNFRIDGKTLRADLHALATDGNRDKLMEMAETIPDTFGLSVSFSGPDEIKGNQALSRCVEIYSADLVSEPAANPNGLFSAKLDRPNNGKPMEPDPMKQCEAMLSKFAAEYAQKFSALESAISELKSNGQSSQMETIQTKVTELEAKTSEMAKNALTVESVAKQFAAVVGTSPAAGVALSSGGDSKEPKLADVGEALVQKYFEATKSKAKAFERAGTENGPAVEALIQSGRKIVYTKAA